VRISFFIIAAICVALGCNWLSDDGVHLAESLKTGAKALQRSADTDLTVAFEPLDGTNQIYTVQFCKNSAVVV
jgi:archaellum component FlaG (FlaF/FlaG flagellin family)